MLCTKINSITLVDFRKDVPYNYTSVGTVKSHHRFEKYEKFINGPILSPDTIDSGYSGTIFVMKQDGNILVITYLVQTGNQMKIIIFNPVTILK